MGYVKSRAFAFRENDEEEQVENGAGTRIRTVDLLITSQLLYQLSYAGNVARIIDNP